MVQRNMSLDILKLIMAAMVVALHSDFLSAIDPLLGYATTNGLFRLAVPTFLLINGFYFHKIVIGRGYSDWFKRVFYLYVFWMLFYVYFWFRPADLTLFEIAKLVKTFVIGYHHLWYVSGLFGAALLLVLLRRFSDRVLLILGLSFFLVGVCIQYAGNYHIMDNDLIDSLFNKYWAHRNFLFLSFPFFLTGYFISKWELKEKFSLSTSLCFAFSGLGLLIAESIVNYSQPRMDGGFDNLFSLILLCPALFLVFQKFSFTGSSKLIGLLASSIYFIHPLIIVILRKFLVLNSIMLTFTTLVLAIISSCLIIWAHKRFKFIL